MHSVQLKRAFSSLSNPQPLKFLQNNENQPIVSARFWPGIKLFVERFKTMVKTFRQRKDHNLADTI